MSACVSLQFQVKYCTSNLFKQAGQLLHSLRVHIFFCLCQSLHSHQESAFLCIPRQIFISSPYNTIEPPRIFQNVLYEARHRPFLFFLNSMSGLAQVPPKTDFLFTARINIAKPLNPIPVPGGVTVGKFFPLLICALIASSTHHVFYVSPPSHRPFKESLPPDPAQPSPSHQAPSQAAPSTLP
jgi:hypothetical protein